MNELSLESRLLQWIGSTEYHPVKPKVLMKQLELPETEYRALRLLIKKLSREGKLQYMANHLVAPNGLSSKRATRAERSDQVSGTFRLAYSGYGFVKPDAESNTGAADFDEDIFIPMKYVGSAMDGDRVRVRVRRGRSGRFEGMVDEVLDRSRRQFTGTYRTIDGRSVVWLDGVLQEQPIEVGDVRGLPLESDDKVIVEMVRYPDPWHPGEGIILEVLGSGKNPAVDTIAVMHQFGLVEAYPEAAIEQARNIADAFTDSIPEGRRDLTDLPTLTIDPADARDFDDAISLHLNEAGHWELFVHIADVSSFVPLGTPLDLEARQRATSVYLPDKVIPMLPEIISNHLASLQPDKNRWAKTVLIEMTDSGNVVHCEVFNSVIRNAKRLNYDQVDEFLKDREAWREKLTADIFRTLADMHRVAMMLRARRMKGGSLELSLPEVKIDLDRGGKVKGAHLVEHTESHQVIEEFMLAANQAVATWLDDLQLPFLRRAHAPPRRAKMEQLAEFLTELGFETTQVEDRFALQKIIDSVRGNSMEYGVNYAILKSMSKAVYQPDFEMHYALNMKHYCHFTSPIRRYPDLVVHRIVDRLIQRGMRPRDDAMQLASRREGPGPLAASGGTAVAAELQSLADPMDVLVQLGDHCSDKEQNAEAAERELVRVKLLHYMSKRLGDTMHGVIATVRPEGFVVRCLEIPAEGFVTIESLPDDRYRYDRQTHTIEGFRSGNRFRLGDQLIIQVAKVDLARRDLEFLMVRKTGEATRESPSKSHGHKHGTSGRSRSAKKNKSPGMHGQAGRRSGKTNQKTGPSKKKRRR